MAVTNIAAELKARGFIAEEGGGAAETFLAEKRTVYHGIDPTAESLHAGHLVSILAMKRLADAGHSIYFIVGGGTGMIGDPRESGERVLLDAKTVKKNTKALKTQISRVFGKAKYKIVDNADWLLSVSLVEFLRDTGKHFTVNQLVKRDIIKRRLDAEDPLSFTEFSYSLLQAYDYWHLFKKYGVDLQIGGSDQWANIISGVELIRKREGKSVYAFTLPIITDKATGKKFGKSEGNAVWLDPEKTSPFSFYQFWLNTPDEGLEHYLKIFTVLPLADIEALAKEHSMNPGARLGQKRLAALVTGTVHGEGVAQSAMKVSDILFGTRSLENLDRTDRATLLREAPTAKVLPGTPLTDVLVSTGLAASKGEGRRLIEQGGVSINSVAVTDVARVFSKQDLHDGLSLLRRGKKVAVLTA